MSGKTNAQQALINEWTALQQEEEALDRGIRYLADQLKILERDERRIRYSIQLFDENERANNLELTSGHFDEGSTDQPQVNQSLPSILPPPSAQSEQMQHPEPVIVEEEEEQLATIEEESMSDEQEKIPEPKKAKEPTGRVLRSRKNKNLAK
ncbi:Oidioi.mRNA.OKI2018_I69.chr1.g1435.t1.cds [Oikopleura dioica]|uniref:Oidioi.mRNA.OKI2018_I69.chr1.g1435.t1.cds n=1 Tax=Oikopleura dioica TaxID=34765 RepID=A0ABN7SNF6_OIKDI|nr:Oidioi.mRNA.OKI2018_I69.chr1.g1435.t1.cds [Oikopleura dioica]